MLIQLVQRIICLEDDLFSTMTRAWDKEKPLLVSLLKKDHLHYLLPSLKFGIFNIVLLFHKKIDRPQTGSLFVVGV